ncbi:MAG: hypothetical protein KAS87_04120 [Candidatus Omnitrophica bacterium]|nr:hypothetical protein [Candidatus Omnitrophota bacterium]
MEKMHVHSYKRIVREANKSIKSSSLRVQKGKYERILLRNDISAETKKKRLAKNLHELIIKTFSVNIDKIKNKKGAIKNLRTNVGLIRETIHKIKAINNYIEEAFLRELGIIKKSLIVKAVKSNTPAGYLEKSGRVLSKERIDRIEQTIYELIQKIIFFDKKLLKDYKKKETKIISKEKLRIKDLEGALKIESELLDVLEAKIPPSGKVKEKLFKKEIFNRWVPMVFALLSSFETEYGREELIFSKIKKNNKLRKKIEKKIKHIANEKEKLLKIKEKRVLAMKGFGKISDDYRQTFHEYVSAAGL